MNKPSPRVSIIIPCYNAEKYIEECIQSALNQSHAHCEIIVINDGSTDNSLAVINKFKDSVKIVDIPNQGGGAARNKGIQVASGDFIKFLDADDWLYPDIVAKQVNTIQDLPQHVIPYGIAVDYDSNMPVFDHVQTNMETPMTEMLGQLCGKNILTSLPLHRKALLDMVHGFDPSLRRGQEWNLHIRLALHGVIFHKTEDLTYKYRSHDEESRISVQASKPNGIRKAAYTYIVTANEIYNHYNTKLPNIIKRSLFPKLMNNLRLSLSNSLQEEADTLIMEMKKYYHFPAPALSFLACIKINIYWISLIVIGSRNTELILSKLSSALKRSRKQQEK